MKIKSLCLGLAISTTGLVAGVFYAFSVAINPAFARLSDASYIAAMQAINSAIVNPVFAFSYFGAPLLLVAVTILHRSNSTIFSWLLAACVVYWTGSLGVTVFGNIPLNDNLALFLIKGASLKQMALVRHGFDKPWNQWHLVRTCASVISLILLIIAGLANSKPAEVKQ
jgi:uncharacterized membrane protein